MFQKHEISMDSKFTALQKKSYVSKEPDARPNFPHQTQTGLQH